MWLSAHRLLLPVTVAFIGGLVVSTCDAALNAPCRNEADCDPQECCAASLPAGKNGIFSECKTLLGVGDVCSPPGTVLSRVRQCPCGHGTTCVTIGQTTQCLYLPG
ncbi:hypothetical protein Btru_018059 [Bulinus truncatus]|nr:hypothetical protein Btru_018059 [Bulinus truncatus]